MAESPEHQFVTACFNDVVREFSTLDLYTFGEIDRRQFDFGCTIRQTLERVVVGQTLWRHSSGIEKDVRTLLLDDSADVKVYLVRGDAPTLRRVDETVSAFRETRRFDDRLFRLLHLDVPVFDADKDEDRETVRRHLRGQVTDHLLLRVIFGGLNAENVGFLLDYTNTTSKDPAFNLRLLSYIRSGAFISLRGTAFDLGVSANKVRERQRVLTGAGLAREERSKLVVTDRGETFARLLDRLAAESRAGGISPELRFLLDRVGCPIEGLLVRPEYGVVPLQPAHTLFVALGAFDAPAEWRLDHVALATWWDSLGDAGVTTFLRLFEEAATTPDG